MLFFSVFLIIIINVHSQDELPGVEDLSSGYDAAKMLSANEQSSKYRIFDLSQSRPTPFKIKVLGDERSYTTPQLVQATEIGVRKEDNCETISYDFKSFRESYYQSISFGFGVGLPDEFGVSVEFSVTLKQIHEAMTKNNMAVGTSTIWWGLYSVQLAPPFLMKFDPLFVQSVDLLASQAPNPSNNDDQLYYNQFIETYGTHYVSRIVVGGTAHLYSLINSNYYQASTYEETKYQIGLMFKYEEFSVEAGYSSSVAWAAMQETFKKSTKTLSVFQPPVASQSNQSDWQTWAQKAGDQPVVVNRTLYPIYQLIRNKPTVQAYLRKTIEYYLKTGVLPTFAQLNGRTTNRLAKITPKPVGPIYGLDVVGCGYDITLMESKFCILDNRNFSENELWLDPYNSNLSYSIPNGWFVTNTPESLTLDGSILVTSVEDYFRWTRSVTASSSSQFFGLFKRHKQRTVTDFYRRLYQDYYNLILRIKQISWYTLSVSAFPYPKLNFVAQKAFDNLPTHFSIKDLNIWQEFFDTFGTHLVVSANMGGQAWIESWIEKCLTYEHTEQWIDEQISNNWFIFFHSTDYSSSHYKEVDETFKKNSIVSSQILGGNTSMDHFTIEKWLPTIKAQPHPISHRLILLYEILPEGDRRNALKAAIDHVLKIAKQEDQNYIAQLEQVRGPPKTRCSQNAIRTRRDTTTTNAEMTTDLCPYVGYNGIECLGKAMSRSLPVDTPKLPIGVGMTIDITTGQLLLPALEYTYFGNNIWTDSISNMSYQTSRGITFVDITAKDNNPIVRVFRTAAELSNAWKYEKLSNSWLGGEFGHSQSLLNIYRQFFSNNQATAVTQKPTVLYRLRVENLKLNKYVKEAIGKLSIEYNETLYNDFLRNWGTHIIQQSLIGGMHEQQVLFKDCVFSFNGAITSQNLEEYLKKDIVSETLGNSFYADRRKIRLDHWLGGNPIEQNETKWRQTLANNPALLKIEKYVPWSDVPEIDPRIQENLRKIIDIRTKAADKIRTDEENQLAEQRINGSYMTRQGFIGLLNNGRCDIIPTTFGSVDQCSDGCPTDTWIKTGSDFFDKQQLWYIRDKTTGFIQARLRLDSRTVLYGSRINAGCSSFATGQSPTSAAYVCVSCDLVNSFSNQCVCVCPKYPTSS